MNNGKLRSLSHRLSNKKVVGLIPHCSEVSTLDSKIPKAKPNYNEDIQTNPKKPNLPCQTLEHLHQKTVPLCPAKLAPNATLLINFSTMTCQN